MSPSLDQQLQQQEFGVERRSPLEVRSNPSFRISTMMKGDRLVTKKGGEMMEDYQRSRRNSPLMKLPTLNMTGDYFTTSASPTNMSTRKDNETSPSSFIDGVLEVIDYGLKIEDELESDDDVMVVPVKLDNYASKRTRYSRDKRRKELLLDNAFAITNALRVLEDSKSNGLSLSSGDEESLDAGDIDDGYDSDLQ